MKFSLPPGWVAIPLAPTAKQWQEAQGTLLDANWDAVTCLAMRLQTLIGVTRGGWTKAVALHELAMNKPVDVQAEGSYPEMPEPTIEGTLLHPEHKICYSALVHFTADQMRAFADATVAHRQQQAAAKGGE